MAQLGDLFGRRALRHQQQRRVAGKAHDEEDDGQHAEGGDDGLANATGKVPRIRWHSDRNPAARHGCHCMSMMKNASFAVGVHFSSLRAR